jgi:hypothetical protein
MGIHDHILRSNIVSEAQHSYDHELQEFPYSHPAFPGGPAGDAADALDYIFNVLYPRQKPAVATPADLPTGVDTPNVGDVAPTLYDQRFVNDDGDGNAAQYMFYKQDGQVAAQWNKIADVDWGENSVIQGLLDQTQYLYVRKFGTTDYDPLTELPLAGKDAGQHIYGGDTANQNLTLHATNGDDPGVHTGYVQVDDDFRPYDDLTFDCGTATERWNNLYAGTLIVGTATMTITSNGTTGLITDTNGQISFDDENLLTTGNVNAAIVTASTNLVVDDTVNSLTIGTGSILSSTGSISFGDENLSTTGTLASGVHTVSGTLILGSGSITDTGGAISFGDENLSTTGTLGAGVTTVEQLNVNDIRLDNDTISISTLNTDLRIQANGTGVISLDSAVSSGNITTVGTIDINGQLDVDSITLDGTSITVVGENLSVENLLPDVDNGRDLGTAALRFQDIYFSGIISDGTGDLAAADLMRLDRVAFRDVAKTQPVQAGDALFYDSVSGKWLASAPDLEIDHGSINGLSDDDHSQYALLVGRFGGQTLHGSNTTAESLLLRGNSVDGIGLDIGDHVLPSADGSVNLGSGSRQFDDLYMTGEGFGFRAENGTEAAILAAGNAATVGRLWYGTDTGFLYADAGGTVSKIGNNSYNEIRTNVQLQTPTDVSASITDARNAIWQLVEQSTGEILGVPLQIAATTITVANTVALPAGNYRLIGIEV